MKKFNMPSSQVIEAEERGAEFAVTDFEHDLPFRIIRVYARRAVWPGVVNDTFCRYHNPATALFNALDMADALAGNTAPKPANIIRACA